ncbi:MAG: hypothetical protein [Bacteriophage sp.]|nr:MAG: hypothetical protein [Bacteriophage sp.]
MDKILYPCGAKILPLTYDDSLSYYEQVCKLTTKMNEIIDFINTGANEALKEYIDTQFNNLIINAIYNENTETITLKKDVKS